VVSVSRRMQLDFHGEGDSFVFELGLAKIYDFSFRMYHLCMLVLILNDFIII
jgi:hypothetical protein